MPTIERVGSLVHKVAKAASISRLVLALKTWICSPMARPPSRRLSTWLGICRIGRVDQHGDARGAGHQLAQQFQPLCRQLADAKN